MYIMTALCESIAIAAIAGIDGSEAQRYAKQVDIGFSSDVVTLRAAALDNQFMI
jgi:hypothetical protein